MGAEGYEEGVWVSEVKVGVVVRNKVIKSSSRQKSWQFPRPVRLDRRNPMGLATGELHPTFHNPYLSLT